ncbi:alpha-(1,3)-fucosyltransferase C-like isoform X2 [Ornithodoros turicata]|uniref:alpha-(1,3)-fucosyltransferase C-like isoform X2 n=1 Tax=Ornithodoros turicata TaxID=34597 RepID=UPI0031392217
MPSAETSMVQIMARSPRWALRILVLVEVAAIALCIYWTVHHPGGVPLHRTQMVYGPMPWYSRASSTSFSNIPRTSTTDIPRILLWTPYFGSRLLGLSSQDEIEIPECSRRCHVTYNRDLLSSSDAVVFHVRDLSLWDVPARRSPAQKWVFWCMEAPPNSGGVDLDSMKSVFNWTMTYRADSDVPVAYGSLERRENGKEIASSSKRIWEQKNKTAVWVVSNCAPHSGRAAFIKELQRYIHIDIYGRCGTHKCPKDSDDACFRKFESEYYFWLALENSLCRDYVTEKLFYALQRVIVPVALGAVNYSAVAAPHSVIDASAFEGPKELADYMENVKSDFRLYQRYLEWKDRYDVVSWDDRFCSLCEKLYSAHFRTKSAVEDLSSWWIRDSGCYEWNDEHWRARRRKDIV